MTSKVEKIMNNLERQTSVPPKVAHGLSLVTAALFIVGETAGTGVLAAPQAVAFCGWLGVAVLFVVCFLAGYSGIYLGRSWLLVEQLSPQYDAKSNIKIRNPYSVIGYTAAGPLGRFITSATLVIQLSGGAICMLLICAELVYTLVRTFQIPILINITFCSWIIIIGLGMIPFQFFGSPADFWPVAIMAVGGTGIASVLITYAIIHSDHEPNPPRETPTLRSFFVALGTIIFGYGGASAMPTFQMDMRNKSHFAPAVTLAFILMLGIFLPLSVSGYYFYGSDVQSSVLRNLPDGAMLTIINVMMICHVFAANLILINPVNLLLEECVGVEHSFNIKRCSLRVIVGLACLLIALSIPRFGKILSFAGSCAVTLQSFVLPPLFYLLLCRKVRKLNEQNQSEPIHRLGMIITEDNNKNIASKNINLVNNNNNNNLNNNLNRSNSDNIKNNDITRRGSIYSLKADGDIVMPRRGSNYNVQIGDTAMQPRRGSNYNVQDIAMPWRGSNCNVTTSGDTAMQPRRGSNYNVQSGGDTAMVRRGSNMRRLSAASLALVTGSKVGQLSGKISTPSKCLMIATMAIGLFVGVASSVYSFIDMIDPDSFTLPCYVQNCEIGD